MAAEADPGRRATALAAVVAALQIGTADQPAVRSEPEPATAAIASRNQEPPR